MRILVLLFLLGIASEATAQCGEPQIRLTAKCAYYWPMICEEALTGGVDPELVIRVVKAESSCNPEAISPAGALGLMQLMPGTAIRYGVRSPFHPQWNVRGGVAYLRFLLARYNGDVVLAVAGYNAGEDDVDRYGRRVPPFPETQNFVWSVLGISPRSSYIISPVIVQPVGIHRWQDEYGQIHSSNLPVR